MDDFYASDVSISAGFFGTLVDHTGIFAEAEAFAAAAQGADRTMFSVHGSSGSNWIVLRTLALERSDALVLVARNIHHSVINAIKAFGLDFRFIPTPYEPRFEAVLPPSVDDVLDALTRYPEALAVLYTSPTYEGLAANTRAIVRAVHAASDHAMVIVDEAWGGHLRFHPDLPESAMGAGADICVQSTHKLAGGLQQTGLIHWKTARVDSELMEEAYREYVTTSPSYHLLASADAAVRTLAARGEDELGRAIERTRGAQGGAARARSPTSTAWTTPRGSRATATASAAATSSRRRVGLSRYDLSGYDVAQALVERGIVIEKAGLHTITLITTFQLGPDAVPETVDALHDILAGHCLPGDAREPMPTNPFSAIDDRPGDPPLPGAPLREVDRPRGRAARGDRQGRGRGGRGLSAGHPGDPRGLPRQRRRRRVPHRGPRQGRLDRRPRHEPRRPCASCNTNTYDGFRGLRHARLPDGRRAQRLRRVGEHLRADRRGRDGHPSARGAARGALGRRRSAPPTSAAARAAPARGCASAASRRSTASTSRPRCSTWPGRARSTPRLVEADVSDTGLESGAYDLVVTCLVDEHLADLRPLYAEARRIARPGGVYVLVGFHPHFIMASGMPTHYDSASGEAVAIQTYVHLLSDHVSAGLAAGWTLVEMRERVIDDAWLELKPKWASLRDQPIAFAVAWRAPDA